MLADYKINSGLTIYVRLVAPRESWLAKSEDCVGCLESMKWNSGIEHWNE